MVKGVVNEIIREGGILDMFPVRTVTARQLVYNRENVLPSGAFHAIADTWTASEDIDVTQVTLTLAIHGDQKNIDDTLKKTYVTPNQLEAEVVLQSAKGLKQRIERALIYEATGFTGLHGLVTTNQTVAQGSGATEAALSASNLNRMLDLVRPKAEVMVTPHRIAQRLDQSGQGVNSVPLVYIDASGKGGIRSGQKVEYWRDVPLRRSDFMATPDTGALRETIASGAYSAETGGASGSILAMRFGQPEDGGVFLAIGNELFEVVGPYESEAKNARWIRIRTYLAPGMGSTRSLGRVDGISDAAVVA